MYETFVRNRISELRTKKGVSEYKMSLDLGHSKSYIQSISSGKALSSFSEFLYICAYLDVTRKDFYDWKCTIDQVQKSEECVLNRSFSESAGIAGAVLLGCSVFLEQVAEEDTVDNSKNSRYKKNYPLDRYRQ